MINRVYPRANIDNGSFNLLNSFQLPVEKEFEADLKVSKLICAALSYNLNCFFRVNIQ
jgi:hypothetical protein